MSTSPERVPDPRPSSPDSPLGGIIVVDLSRYLPGPFAALQLAQLGATVVRVQQPPHGDPMRAMPPLDRSGRGYASRAIERGTVTWHIDLGDAAGRADVLELCDRADVVIESFRPGVAARLGVDDVTLRARNPRLVCCSLSGYGQTGPWAQAAGHDGNYEAVAGLLARGGGDEGPTFGPVPIADLAGGLFASTAICAALLRVRETGEGSSIDISLTEAALALQTHLAGDRHTIAGRGQLQGDLACYAIYRCAKDGHVALCALEPKFFRRVLEILELDAELANHQFVPTEQARLRELIGEQLLTRCAEEWDGRFALDETCLTRVWPPDEVPYHPQLAARGAFETLASDPPVPVPTAPYVIDGIRSRTIEHVHSGQE